MWAIGKASFEQNKTKLDEAIRDQGLESDIYLGSTGVQFHCRRPVKEASQGTYTS